MKFIILFAINLLFLNSLQAKEIRTNAVYMPNAPDWLKATRVETVTEKIQYQLEWSTRRVLVKWYSTQKEFSKAHSLGPAAAAVTRSSQKEQLVMLGPKVTDKNFDTVFGHELVHVIFSQKYVGAIPEWLEEGLANHLAKKREVDYEKLAKRPFPKDVRELTHPYRGDRESIHYHYMASQALAEMLDKRCKLDGLLRLSVERKMADYIKTYCEIKDLNVAFKEWILSQVSKKPQGKS